MCLLLLRSRSSGCREKRKKKRKRWGVALIWWLIVGVEHSPPERICSSCCLEAGVMEYSGEKSEVLSAASGRSSKR